MGPKMGPKSLQNRPLEPPKTLLEPSSRWMLFPVHFSSFFGHLGPEKIAKSAVLSSKIQVFHKLLLPAVGGQKSTQNDPKNGSKNWSRGLPELPK